MTIRKFLAAALMGVFASTAYAQSSVTLYGLIDTGVSYISNAGAEGHSSWNATNGNINGSRWGLRGNEDLGGGLSAIFTLESGFNVLNGTASQSGRLFGRQAFVGLRSNQYGTITVGRQYDSVVDYLAPLSLATNTSFAHPYDNDNLQNSIRFNNTIKYTSRNYNGFTFGGMYGFSNSSNFALNRVYSVGASYTYGGLKIAAGYLQLNNDPSSAANFSSVPGAVSGDYKFIAARQRTFGGAINYTFGPAKVGLVYSQTSLTGLGGIAVSGASYGPGVFGAAQGSGRFQNLEGNVTWSFTPDFRMQAMYTYTRASLAGVNPNYNSVNLLGSYNLSPRTDLYLQGGWQHVSSNGKFSPQINNFISSQYTGDLARNQVVVSTGIRHRF